MTHSSSWHNSIFSMVKEPVNCKQFDFQHLISLITECLHTTDVLGWYKKMFSIDLAKKELGEMHLLQKPSAAAHNDGPFGPSSPAHEHKLTAWPRPLLFFPEIDYLLHLLCCLK